VAKLSVKGQVDYVDLRKVTARGEFLKKIIKKHDLQHLECVVFTNNYQYKPRFRMVINLHGEPFLTVPTVDEEGKHSLYLRVSEYLSKFAQLTDTRVELEKLAEGAKQRIARKRKKQREEKKQNGV